MSIGIMAKIERKNNTITRRHTSLSLPQEKGTQLMDAINYLELALPKAKVISAILCFLALCKMGNVHSDWWNPSNAFSK